MGGGSRVKLGQSADFDIGGLRVSPARRQISFNRETQTLEPRVMQVLVALAEARPSVVSRDQLAQACWGGLNVGDDAMNRCIVALRRLAREFDPEPFTIETVPRVGYALREAGSTGAILDQPVAAKSARHRLLVPILLLFGGLVVALVLWHPWQRANAVSVAVAPASSSPDSEALARDLTAKLGMLSSVTQGAARLLDRSSRENSDLLFEVDATRQGRDLETGVVLLNNKREVLWSKVSRQPQSNLGDLKLQIAASTGKVLQCALEAISNQSDIHDREALKTYLNGCATYAEAHEENTRDVRAMFRRVTASSPRFQPGWRRLLITESEIVQDFTFDEREAASDRSSLERTIAAARRLNSEIPAILMATAALMPASAIGTRMRLADQAVEKGPNDADVLRFQSGLLMTVGRMNDAVRQATKAARLDPLSPATRQWLIVTFASDGRVAEANDELRRAEQLWPGAVNLLEARYLLHLRFGDPKEAIRLRDSGSLRVSGAPLHGSFLEARANPSPANIERAIRDSRAYFSRNPLAIVLLSQTLVAFGREDELYTVLLDGRQPYDSDDLLEVLFRPAFRNFHHDPRMMRVAARLGLLQYWQASGKWPDFCFEPDLPYDCRKEAAAIAT